MIREVKYNLEGHNSILNIIEAVRRLILFSQFQLKSVTVIIETHETDIQKGEPESD